MKIRDRQANSPDEYPALLVRAKPRKASARTGLDFFRVTGETTRNDPYVELHEFLDVMVRERFDSRTLPDVEKGSGDGAVGVGDGDTDGSDSTEN